MTNTLENNLHGKHLFHLYYKRLRNTGLNKTQYHTTYFKHCV